jgi:hypothetical protein
LELLNDYLKSRNPPQPSEDNMKHMLILTCAAQLLVPLAALHAAG